MAKGRLSRKSIKNLFGIVRAIYNFQFDEMAQCGKPIVSPWLVKWKKVAPTQDRAAGIAVLYRYTNGSHRECLRRRS